MLHYIVCVRNKYRVGRKQVSFVVDVGLWLRVKDVAAARGVSVTRLVTGFIEEGLDGFTYVGSRGGVGSSSEGRFAGQVGGRGSVGGFEQYSVGGRVDPIEDIA
jgi:hypothetical protein